MYAETTNPNFVNQFAETLDDPRELYQKIEASFKKPRAPVYYEPQWEDVELHGPARKVSLRGHDFDDAEVTGRFARPELRLPPMPQKNVDSSVLIAGAVIGAGLLGWYLLRRKDEPVAVAVKGLQLESLPAWAMT